MRSGNKWAMKKTLIVFLLSLFSANAFAGYGGYIGTHDNRRYGSLEEPEYHGVAKLTANGLVKVTGVFVSKNIILTNSHVVFSCKNGCVAEFWNGSEYEKSNLKVLKYNEKSMPEDGTDWGLLLSDKDSNFYKSIAPMSSIGPVNRGGYGALRIIEDDEIPFLKDLYTKVKEEYKEECDKKPDCFNRIVEKKLEKLGKKPLFKDDNNFKVQNCNIVRNLKKSNKMVETDCDSAGGDSGAPLLRSNVIVGLNVSGLHKVFGEEKINAKAIRTENFYTETQRVIKQYQFANEPEETLKLWDKNFDADKEVDIVKPDSIP